MNKIMQGFQITVTSVTIFLSTAPKCTAQQDTALNKYGLWVISSISTLQKTVQYNTGKAMVDLKKAIPGIVLDLRYNTTSNFMHTRLYSAANTTYMRKTAADALAKVQLVLKEKGMGIKIFDAYRPYSVTEKMWEPVQDDRYAADPKKGSGHNRGTAVDLTLIYLSSGNELPMGTDFDNFSDTAHHAFSNLPDAILKNRLLLKQTMEENGFKVLDTEWWHYSLPNARDYELLDLSFEVLAKMHKRKNRKKIML
jgi:zinc D-Ala-D-Ala dipeptidase